MNDNKLRQEMADQGYVLLRDVPEILKARYELTVSIDAIKDILSDPAHNKGSCLGESMQFGKMKRWGVKESELEDIANILKDGIDYTTRCTPPHKEKFIASVFVLSAFYKNTGCAGQEAGSVLESDACLTIAQAQQLLNVPELTIYDLIGKNILQRRSDDGLEKEIFIGVLSAVRECTEQGEALFGILRKLNEKSTLSMRESDLLRAHKRRVEERYFDIYCGSLLK